MPVALVTGLVLLGSGCSNAADDPVGQLPPSESPIPVEVDAPSTECSAVYPEPLGDVVAAVLVEEPTGSYCQVTIEPNSAVLEYDDALLNPEFPLEPFGFTQEDVEAALLVGGAFVAEEVIDSRLLDNADPERFDAWFEEHSGLFAPDYVPDGELTQIPVPISPDSVGSPYPGYEVVFSGGVPPVTMDGGPRIADAQIEVSSIAANRGTTGADILILNYTALVQYRLTDESAITHIRNHKPTEEADALIASRPDLTDGEGSTVTASIQYSLAFNKAGLISGQAFTYDTSEDAFPAATT